MKVFKKVKRLLFPMFLDLHGLSLIVRLLYIYPLMLVFPIFHKLLYAYGLSYARTVSSRSRPVSENRLRDLKSRRSELLRFAGSADDFAPVERLGLDQSQLEELTRLQRAQNEVVIGDIDQDGYLLSRFGPLRNAATTSAEEFLPRTRFDLTLVSVQGKLCVKKRYRGNAAAFVNELSALHHLRAAGCSVPTLFDVDFENLALTFSYIVGRNLRLDLAARGALILDREVVPSAGSEPAGTRAAAAALQADRNRWIKSEKALGKALADLGGAPFTGRIFEELQRIHAAGFVVKDVKHGNVILEEKSNRPYFIDFDYAISCLSMGKLTSMVLRDRDIEQFNASFLTNELTYDGVRQQLRGRNLPLAAGHEGQQIKGLYAPAYFGKGLGAGPIWSIDRGFGRWHFILKHHLPPLAGARILDIGANNCQNSLQMLRAGAREAVAIELDPKFIEQGQYLKKVFEWSDNTRYDLKCVQANMLEIPRRNLGRFDIVVALCSIYYLDDQSITDLARYISGITDVFVLQCNIAADLQPEISHTKASVEYAVKTLASNGFPATTIIAPRGYSRPLVIGRKAAA